MADHRYNKNQTGETKDDASFINTSTTSTLSKSTYSTSFSNSKSTSSTSFSNTNSPSSPTSFTSTLGLLGSGGRVTVSPTDSRARVDPSQGPVNWDSLVDKVFTEEIANYF